MSVVAIPRQDPIEVFTDDDHDVIIRQEQMGETECVIVSPQNIPALIVALQEEFDGWKAGGE